MRTKTIHPATANFGILSGVISATFSILNIDPRSFILIRIAKYYAQIDPTIFEIAKISGYGICLYCGIVWLRFTLSIDQKFLHIRVNFSRVQIERTKVQGIEVKQNIFEKLLGISRIVVYMAGKTGMELPYVIPFVDAQEAKIFVRKFRTTRLGYKYNTARIELLPVQ